MFIAKLADDEDLLEFGEYFIKYYLDKNSGWHVAASPIGYGNHNNFIEGFNEYLKSEFT